MPQPFSWFYGRGPESDLPIVSDTAIAQCPIAPFLFGDNLTS